MKIKVYEVSNECNRPPTHYQNCVLMFDRETQLACNFNRDLSRRYDLRLVGNIEGDQQ